MRASIFLVVSLAISTATSNRNGAGNIINIGEEMGIPEANNGHGDIVEKPSQSEEKQNSATNNLYLLWQSPIAYVLEKDLEMNAKGVIMRALDQFRLKSCLDFKPRDSEEYFISFQKKDGCFSYVGQVKPKGQILSIGRFCDEISTVEHEILHALGFYHEQSRYDRDDYVTIVYKNIESGMEFNFLKVSKEMSTTQGLPYDYTSVMHYGKDDFTNGNGSTIITKDPKFQDVIGQRQDMSPIDAEELNRLYKCKSTVALQLSCSFSDGNMCGMNRCSHSGSGWKMVTQVNAGPMSDHTNLPNGSGESGKGPGYFMHASTKSGQEGDSAWLETPKMQPKRECNVQCLQFYFFQSGNLLDHLNIWLREFQNEWDNVGTVRLMGQINGRRTFFWQLMHVPLNATKLFQVEFEVRKGAGSSWGGFSIDDINLSEVECPHVTMQLNNFENLLTTSYSGRTLYSSRHYSSGGYAFAAGTVLRKSYFGLFVQLLSGENDDELEWPVPQRQATFQVLDQNPKIGLQMSKQRSITSDLSTASDGSFLWDDPRKVGVPYVDENNETIYAGPLLGKRFFARLEEMKSRDFIKGGSAVLVFNFQDITPLVNGSVLPCPKLRPVKIEYPPRDVDLRPCSSRILTTPHPYPKSTDDPRILTTSHPHPKTTDDDSVFGHSAGLVSTPVLALLLALMLLMP